MEQAEQMLVVTVQKAQQRAASVTAYAKKAGEWIPIFGPLPAVIGKNGVTMNKMEGDRKTPMGLYPIRYAFGTAVKPHGVHLPYRMVTRQDYWIDDPASPDYNRWVTCYSQPKKYWNSFEKLSVSAYKYALIIGYNDDPPIAGAGSAIFLHVWRGPASYTAGCVALAEADVLRILRWLHPENKPVIWIGTIQGAPDSI
ncbi:L,D-peptidoglycan transpeptidase YkuD (ErfK/YbiS/YcfS/YnhG family) [Aneurinibacillus soli]|uniref:L,D-transpeptidase catalytic domain n=1 Tax=Aneurinibacillus soli TaxID=1500254 RepID=A0A0U5ATQ0_9BACL|nr:L,D-transpeptidase family protein [Aneurinibacillus soli]PYE62568.1 L,D-peptidoglycan transpeptidase YkuD (ErfK/YbiS/YcfS/YnhG family) [Aneurinibacillus soli]BAU27130.1 L,D-transpeptidase catalytic domain [Aneurinibacillus soli]